MKCKKISLLGLLGKSRTGKDFMKNKIIDLLNKYNKQNKEGWIIYKIKCADKLKNHVQDKYKPYFSIHDWENSIGNNYREDFIEDLGCNRRDLLQREGTELLKKDPMYIDTYIKDTYLKILKNNKDSKNSSNILIIVSDIRNEVEAKAINACSGMVIKLNRPLHKRYPSIWKEYKSLMKKNNVPEIKSSISKDNVLLKFIENNHKDLWRKLTHKTEVSVDEVNKSEYIGEFSSNDYEKIFKKIIKNNNQSKIHY